MTLPFVSQKKQALGRLRVRSFTSKLLIIGDQLKTFSLEGFQELVFKEVERRRAVASITSLQAQGECGCGRVIKP